MILNVISLNDDQGRDRYSSVLNAVGNARPFYGISFLESFCLDKGEIMAFVYMNDEEDPLVMMPFVLRPMDDFISDEGTYFDVISPYGFNGPFMAPGSNEGDLTDFWREVDKWYHDKNVVSEFLRFDLNRNFTEYTGALVPNLEVVKGKLIGENDIWKNYDRKVRKNVKKARRYDLEVKIYHEDIPAEVIEQFHKIYVHTMDRANANEQFYFSLDVLKRYIADPSTNNVLMIVLKDGVPISTELVLLAENNTYSFLGGTISEYFNLRPNDLLKHEFIKWACENGFEYYVLGGGQRKNDGIFLYKKAFFPEDIVTFYTGRKILNEKVYEQLCKENPAIVPEDNIENGFFPLYRKK